MEHDMKVKVLVSPFAARVYWCINLWTFWVRRQDLIFAILLSNQDQSMNLVQFIIFVILYCGHAQKQVGIFAPISPHVGQPHELVFFFTCKVSAACKKWIFVSLSNLLYGLSMNPEATMTLMW